MQKLFFGETKNGYKVYIDMQSSHAATHFVDDPQLLDLVKEALPELEPTKDKMRFDKDMGKIIGTADIAETEEGDDVVYAKRPRRGHYSRFVKNKEPEPTRYITLDLRKSGEREYDLHTAYIGALVPSFPGGDFLSHESKAFWSKHALVWGKQEIIPGTETKECPW